ncbi:hypothetical protein KEM48_013638 [Puccinia striiformis f. sp. tritici PST-130]|nr:hypothetical protein KEM48_013638 [Puccinia striiformis f. sp. tritici PST-130]
MDDGMSICKNNQLLGLTIILPPQNFFSQMSVNLSSQSHPNSPILAPVGDVRSPIELKVAQLAEQLASIKLTNANKEAEVGNVAAELDKIKKIFKGLSNDVKDIGSMKNMYTEVVSLRNYCRDEVVRIHQEVVGLNQTIQGFHASLEGLSAQVLEIARLGSGVQRDVPEMSILFSGNPKETRRFVFQARTVLHEKSDCFRSVKSKINWIVRHFQLCWQQAASEIFADNMEVDRDLCKTSGSHFLPFSSPRPIVPIHLLSPNLPLIPASSLFDSGASASFIGEHFVSRNRLVIHRLAQPLLCRGFDGSLNRSGQITHYWHGRIIIPLPHSKSFQSSVTLYVTRLASAGNST